ncbi:HAD family hydrolase [Lysinibacillus sp. KU-BSD001]|uniref:HAD family hydrolase n=1 Tax=Lysinibacillus sp. KU-BSD001 TaxID=3141328 RepID=UPI0036E8AA6F
MKAYIFDFDGTLADSAACALHATQVAFQQLSLPVPSEEQISYYMGIPIERSFKEMGAHHLSSHAFEQLLHTFRQMYGAIEDTYLRLFPYVKEGLERLQAQEFLLFVVSSKKTNVLDRNLQTLGIRSYFKDIIGSNQVTQFKPHPQGIQQLLNRYELKANRCLMIGDAIFDILFLIFKWAKLLVVKLAR